MTALSFFQNRKPPAIVVANPVFLDRGPVGGEFGFEVFERDATTLKSLIGTDQYFIIDACEHFFGRLESLEPCQPTHPELALMIGRPTLRGRLRIFPVPNPTIQ